MMIQCNNILISFFTHYFFFKPYYCSIYRNLRNIHLKWQYHETDSYFLITLTRDSALTFENLKTEQLCVMPDNNITLQNKLMIMLPDTVCNKKEMNKNFKHKITHKTLCLISQIWLSDKTCPLNLKVYV